MWKDFLFQENPLQFLAVCACTIFIAYVFTEFIWSGSREQYKCLSTLTRPLYGYGVLDGPHTWKELFPASRGQRQSPINIITEEVVLVDSAAPLSWTSYMCPPETMYILNNGTTVVLQGVWPDVAVPSVQGGPLSAAYAFQAALFRWGLSDAEGSEHTLDYMAFPLEMQVLHAHCGLSPPPAPAPALVAVSYFFEIAEVDNPYLDPIVLALSHVAQPGRAVDILPFSLAWLCPPFHDKYFSYDGSITFPPCTENVRWIVHSHTIGISSRQVAAFRQLMGWDGPLRSNLRPVQSLYCRDVFYYVAPTVVETVNQATEP